MSDGVTNRWRLVVAALTALLVAFTGLVAGVVPTASAALGDQAGLTLDKEISGAGTFAELVPGQAFSYFLRVGCDESPCIDAVLEDQLPVELQGFAIAGLATSSADVSAALTGCAVGGAVVPGCTLSADFLVPLGHLGAEPQVGMQPATTRWVQIDLVVPADLEPTWAWNGADIVNTATLDAATAEAVTASATIRVPVALTAVAGATKDWATGSLGYEPGAQTSFTIGGTNESNVAATSLVLQDPPVLDGAPALDPANPFDSFDFVGLCSPSALPQGADQVQVDAYVFDGTAWSWTTGTPGPAAALPGGVVPATVGGLRLTYTSTSGATIAAHGGAAAQCVTVAQRSETRSGTALIGGATVTNTVQATVAVPGVDPAPATATDQIVIQPVTVDVVAGKQIAPSQIAAGRGFEVTVTAKTESSHALHTLTITEPGAGHSFLSQDLTFAGFTGSVWPTGATAASFTWRYSDGTATDRAITEGALPGAPTPPVGAHVVGFEVGYTGAIVPGTTAEWVFDVATAVDAVAADPGRATFANVVDVSGTNGAGTAMDDADAPITIFHPEIVIDIEKSVRPGQVAPGGTVVASLEAATGTNVGAVEPTEITIRDVWDGTSATNFWDAHRARGVVLTDVPSGASLTVRYATGLPPALTWYHLPLTPADFDAGGLLTVDFPAGVADQIVGLEFIFADPTGFAQGTIVQPNVVFEAAATLRDGTPSDDPDENRTPTRYQNVAVAGGSGSIGGIDLDAPEVSDQDGVGVVSPPPGPGTLLGSKRWVQSNWSSDLTGLAAQSGASAWTTHTWGVAVPGTETVRLSDPVAGQETTPGSTVFQAFDLRTIRAITFAQDPLLRWDTVSQVELFDGISWVTVPAPAGSWMSATGFKGYPLSAAQSASTTGVRVTVGENAVARQSATDPTRPASGTGVASGLAARPFGFSWQLRNAPRTPTASGWVTADDTYNMADAGVVRNDFQVTATTGGTASSRTESDDIVLTDPPPGVGTRKVASPTAVTVPYPGDVAAGTFPRVDFTVDVWNTSAARASSLRVVDPQPCSPANCLDALPLAQADVFGGQTYDAATNPFEKLTLTGLDFSWGSLPIDAVTSTVALWRADGGVTTFSLAVADALPASWLSDVVGIAVVYRSADPATTGGLIPRGSSGSNYARMVLKTQLRETLRSAPDTALEGAANAVVDNDVLAHSADPVLSPDARPYAQSNAEVRLSDAHLDVVATKSVSPSTLAEPRRDDPVTVRIGATDGAATLSADHASVTDVTAAFWQTFHLTGLGAGGKLPEGADRVQVDLRVAGSWVTGHPDPTAALPSVADLSEVDGVRVVWTRADGKPFSGTVPSADWSAYLDLLVQVRAEVEFPVPPIINTLEAVAGHHGGSVVDDDAAATVGLGLGAPRLDVRKDPDPTIVGAGKVTEPGAGVPWSLTFTNTGTSYLGIETLVDDLGDHLVWDGEAATFTGSAGLDLTGLTVRAIDATTLQVDFPDGLVLAPGEYVTVTLGIVLQPGLTGGQRAYNHFVVTADRALQACTNVSGNGQGTAGGLGADECGTMNYVQPQAGSLLFADKLVRGEVDSDRDLVNGAVNTTNPAAECHPNAEGFFRGACAALTRVGAADEWRLVGTNSGTVPYRSVTFVDPLPMPGDRLIATGGQRGSDWRPVLDGDHGLVIAGAPAGTTQTRFVTTSPAVCVGSGTGSTWGSDPRCTAATWEPWDAYAGDWADVTALRVDLAFPGAGLPPGGSITVDYRTVNQPLGHPDAVPQAIVAELWDGALRAWNQSGVTAVTADGTNTQLRRAPARVGVQMAAGALEIGKVADGPAAGFVPAAVTADVVCTVAGVEVDMPGTVTVPVAGTARLDGIPLGASCTVVESGDLGDFGETERAPAAPVTVAIDIPVAPDQEVPAAQAVTLTNTYLWGAFSVTKVLDSEATVADPGPWDFAVQCTAPLGQDVLDTTFRLAADGVWSSPTTGLPIGTTCLLKETDRGAADEVVIVGAGVTDNGDGSAEIVLGATGAVVVTNAYAVGTLEVTKELAGDGADRYGTGEFTVAAVCEWPAGGEVVHEGTVTLTGGQTAAFLREGAPVLLPAGTVCDLTETATGGATAPAEIDPGTITVTGGNPGDGPGYPSRVTVVNTFGVGEIDVVKVVEGSGAAFGTGPFTVRLECYHDVDGAPVPITWDGASHLDLVLDAGNGYRTTVDDLLVGARCAITRESVTGGATAVVLGDEVLVPAAGSDPVELVVTNVFEAASVEVVKEITGDAAAFAVGPYTVRLTCAMDIDGEPTPVTWLGLPYLDLVLDSENGYRATVDALLSGTRCAVAGETVAGGATGSDLGHEVVVGRVPTVITVTNEFTGGHLAIVKLREGLGTPTKGVGPFVATATCTWEIDGVTHELPMTTVTLSAANDYRASVGPLPAGARCVVAETDDGGADATVLAPVDGTVRVGTATTVTVTITNTFEADPPTAGPLPWTGVEIGGALLVMLVLIVGGVGAVTVSRRNA